MTFKPRKKSWLTKTLEYSPARMMSPKRHKKGEPFEIIESDVAVWLCSLPDIMQVVFDTARQSGLIVYDKTTGMWHGSAYRAKAECSLPQENGEQDESV